MVVEEAKVTAGGSRGIPDVDAGESAWNQHPEALRPDPVQLPVHGGKGCRSVIVIEGCLGVGTHGRESVVPHGDHGVRRRGHHQVDRCILDASQVPGISRKQLVEGLHPAGSAPSLTSRTDVRPLLDNSQGVFMGAGVAPVGMAGNFPTTMHAPRKWSDRWPRATPEACQIDKSSRGTATALVERASSALRSWRRFCASCHRLMMPRCSWVVLLAMTQGCIF